MSRSVRIIGWSFAFFSIIMILSEISYLLSDPLDQIKMALQIIPQGKSGMDAIAELNRYSRMWSVYTIVYFWFVFFGSIQFIRFQSVGRMMLEIACWAGIVNAWVDAFLNFMVWRQMQTALSRIPGTMGMGLGNINPIGMSTIILGLGLWIIPTIGMILYLRKPALKTLMH